MGIPTRILDHTAEMLEHLLGQYAKSTKFQAMLAISTKRDDVLEAVFWSLCSWVLRNVDAAEGHLLEIFGRIVGEQRGNSASDAEFRLRIRARIRANRSSGIPEDIYAVFAALLGPTTTGHLRYEWSGPAAFYLTLTGVSLAKANVPVFADFLGDSKAAGVRAVLASYQGDEAEALRFGTCAFLSAGVAAGVTTLPVYSTAKFPSAGELIIDENTADEEVVTYTGKTPTSFTGVSATANAHVERAVCGWTDSPGLGLGRHADPAVGGYAGRWTGVAD